MLTIGHEIDTFIGLGPFCANHMHLLPLEFGIYAIRCSRVPELDSRKLKDFAYICVVFW